MTAPDPGGGLFASLRRLLATALEIVQVRIELLAVEIEQEKLRIFDALLWAALAVLLLGVGITLLVALLLMLFWDGYRLAALAVLCVFFIGGGVLVAMRARARLASPDGLASASVAEIERDRAALGGRE